MHKHQKQKDVPVVDMMKTTTATTTTTTNQCSSNETTQPSAILHIQEGDQLDESQTTRNIEQSDGVIAMTTTTTTTAAVDVTLPHVTLPPVASSLRLSPSTSILPLVLGSSSFLRSSNNAAIVNISEAYMPEEMTNAVVFVNFEGNIGAGKSTLIKRIGPIIAPVFKVHIREERVTEWSNDQDNFLKEYYADQKALAFKFQCNVMCDRLKDDYMLYTALEKWRGVHVVLQERSRSSDRIFAFANHQSGFMDKRDMGIYCKLFDMWQTLLPEHVDITYILNTTIQHCVSNINSRSRNGEESIDSGYLKQLDTLHNKYDWTYGGKQCALEIEYENDNIDRWANKIAGDIVYLVLGKLSRANVGKKASVSDNSMMQLCRIYMNYLRDFSNSSNFLTSIGGTGVGASVGTGAGSGDAGIVISKEQRQRQRQQQEIHQQCHQMQECGLTSIDGRKW